MLKLTDVTATLGGEDILVGIDLHVRPEERVAIVGRNGSGKTTLLRMMAGELQADLGKVERRGVIGYLPQQAVSGSTAPLWDEAARGMTAHHARQAALDAAQRDVEAGVPGAIAKLGTAEEAFRISGGYAVDERIGEVLHGLGFRKDDWQRPCDTFSGGWQMRIALARLLLSEPDVLLLDEPTNHLDLAARSWLARFLDGSKRTLVLVSHDRWLLERVSRRTVEVARGQITSFQGTYAAWVKERAARRDAQASAYETQQREIAHMERFVERFKAKATKAAQARSRIKALDRIDRIDAPEREQKALRLNLPEAPPSSFEAIALREATLGWEDGPDVLVNVELTLERGTRTAVIGPNGAGKSTLLHALTGELAPRSGKRVLGKDVRLGVFSQDLAAALPGELTALEHTMASAGFQAESKVRAVLGALGLPGDVAKRPISALSGGEKARVALAGFVLRPHNVLLLDEPTNHLDVVSVEVLAEALQAFEGALVVVTHDRWFVEQIATHVARVVGDRLEVHDGLDLLDAPIDDPSAAKDAAPSEGALSHAERKRRAREAERAQRRLQRLTVELEAAEAAVAALDEQMFAAATDYPRLRELTEARHAKQATIDALYAEWEQLEDALTDE